MAYDAWMQRKFELLLQLYQQSGEVRTLCDSLVQDQAVDLYFDLVKQYNIARTEHKATEKSFRELKRHRFLYGKLPNDPHDYQDFITAIDSEKRLLVALDEYLSWKDSYVRMIIDDRKEVSVLDANRAIQTAIEHKKHVAKMDYLTFNGPSTLSQTLNTLRTLENELLTLLTINNAVCKNSYDAQFESALIKFDADAEKYNSLKDQLDEVKKVGNNVFQRKKKLESVLEVAQAWQRMAIDHCDELTEAHQTKLQEIDNVYNHLARHNVKYYKYPSQMNFENMGQSLGKIASDRIKIEEAQNYLQKHYATVVSSSDAKLTCDTLMQQEKDLLQQPIAIKDARSELFKIEQAYAAYKNSHGLKDCDFSKAWQQYVTEEHAAEATKFKLQYMRLLHRVCYTDQNTDEDRVEAIKLLENAKQSEIVLVNTNNHFWNRWGETESSKTAQALVDDAVAAKVKLITNLNSLQGFYQQLQTKHKPLADRGLFSTRDLWYQTIGLFKERAMEFLKDGDKLNSQQDSFVQELFNIKRGRVSITGSTSFCRAYNQIREEDQGQITIRRVQR